MPAPIIVRITGYSAKWPEMAAIEIKRIKNALDSMDCEIHHIGSTSVPGLAAKPVLDLMLVFPDSAEMDGHAVVLENLGYRGWGELGIPGRRYFTHETETGERVTQLHCFQEASPHVERHLAFREYLRARPDAASAYELEKRRCAGLFPEDSHAYSDCKASWIIETEQAALRWYRNVREPNKETGLVEEMQTYYSRRAGEYDVSMGYDNPDVIERHGPIISELRRIAAGRNVLELACGPCFWTRQIADVAARITATDFNESTLVEARKKDLPWDRVSLQQADAYDPGSVFGDFDMVLAVDWFAHVPKSRIAGFLARTFQRIPDGSPLVLIDQTPISGSWTGETDDEGNHIQKRVLANGETFRVIKHFFSDQELHGHLSPHTRDLTIKRFPECRRVLVHAVAKHCMS